jgi:hypothetical protein
MRRHVLCVLPLLIVTIACGSSPASPSAANVHSCSGGTASGTLTATINGASFAATCLDAVSFNGNILGLGGTNISSSNATTFINIAMAVQATGMGTFQIGQGTAANASMSKGGSQFWQAGGISTGTGMVTITSLSSTSAAGSFSFNMVPGPGASGGSGTISITNGSFNITF